MDKKKLNTIKKIMIGTVAATAIGINSASAQESHELKGNQKEILMRDLLQGLYYGPSAPECTDTTS